MKAWFYALLAATSMLVNSHALANDIKDFVEFLDDYKAFRNNRDAESKSHDAKFSGQLVFKEDCGGWFYSDSDSGQCLCPPGNNYLQCLVSAKATITPDRKDVGGRGYIVVMAGSHVLDSKGNWVPMNTRGVYTFVIDPLRASNTFNIPVPKSEVIDRACANNSSDELPIVVGYGAVMPMDIEFARRMKAESEAVGQAFDEDKFILSRARIDGSRTKKYGTIGSVSCRNSTDSAP